MQKTSLTVVTKDREEREEQAVAECKDDPRPAGQQGVCVPGAGEEEDGEGGEQPEGEDTGVDPIGTMLV